MTARQASPDAPGLWWRDGGEGAELWEVSRHTRGLRASAVVGDDTLRDLSPRDGVTWARCVPPDDAEATALRARVEALESALRAVIEPLGAWDRTNLTRPACVRCGRMWPCGNVGCAAERALRVLGDEHE